MSFWEQSLQTKKGATQRNHLTEKISIWEYGNETVLSWDNVIIIVSKVWEILFVPKTPLIIQIRRFLSVYIVTAILRTELPGGSTHDIITLWGSLFMTSPPVGDVMRKVRIISYFFNSKINFFRQSAPREKENDQNRSKINQSLLLGTR